eukprot:5354317-Prymnesium_polylepis.3
MGLAYTRRASLGDGARAALSHHRGGGARHGCGAPRVRQGYAKGAARVQQGCAKGAPRVRHVRVGRGACVLHPAVVLEQQARVVRRQQLPRKEQRPAREATRRHGARVEDHRAAPLDLRLAPVVGRIGEVLARQARRAQVEVDQAVPGARGAAPPRVGRVVVSAPPPRGQRRLRRRTGAARCGAARA